MALHKYYTEEILVEKVQKGEMGWLEYINHNSFELQEEYADYCRQHGQSIDELSAEQFVHYRDELFEKAMEAGDI